MTIASARPADETEAPREEKKSEAPTVVIVGGGPIGLAHAWGLKKLNPNLRVVVLEKYKEYQRSHTLIMQHKPLEALMTATNTLKDPSLSILLSRLKKDPHIRTNELEHEFKTLAEQSGVEIRIEEVKESTIDKQLDELKPDLIIGADGTHSVVNRCLFPEGNQVKVPFDYVLQLRFEIDGNHKADPINSIDFYQSMARYGMIANEYMGRFDEDKKKTPVTMQMMISKEAFQKLRSATSKTPITPYVSSEAGEEKKSDSDSKDDTISYEAIPAEIRGFIENYIKQKWKHPFQRAHHIDPKSVRISVNEAPATYAKQPVHNYHGVPVLLVGDAGLGLSYFKGLNAGIESTAKLFTELAAATKDGVFNKDQIQKSLANYSTWFVNIFAPPKVREVESYSTYQIKRPEYIMRKIRSWKESSMEEDLINEGDILKDYFRFFGADPFRYENKNLYPHRPYDPNIKLGQFSDIPIRYTVKKILKLFSDYFKPYKSAFHFRQDLKQPLVGTVNLLSGTAKIIGGLFTLSLSRFSDGLFGAIRGTLEIITFPLAWTLKPLTRGFVTLIVGKPKIEDNAGAKKLANLGLNLLNEMQEDESLQKDSSHLYKLSAVSSDLHRKFSKALKRGQSSSEELREQIAFSETRSNTKSVDAVKLQQYFLLFSAKKPSTPRAIADEKSKLPMSAVL